jgi:hypothetical protein
MPEEFVTLASYRSPLEAQLSLALLRDGGVNAFLTGDISSNTFSGVEGLGGPVQIQVPAADAQRAADILATAEQEKLDHDWEARAEADAAVWVCSLCGEPVPLERPACPSCQTPREALRREPSCAAPRPRALQAEDAVQKRDEIAAGTPPLPAHELTDEPAELPPLETFQSDDLARRAFRAAAFGCMTLFVPFNLYSLWLLLRLCLLPGEASPENTRKSWWALLMNVGVAFLYLLAFRALYWVAID